MNEELVRQLIEQVNRLQTEVDSLKNNATISFEVGEAFKARVLSDLSGKTTSSETQSVSEGGSSTYNVAKPMDGFLRTFDGKNIPYYDD